MLLALSSASARVANPTSPLVFPPKPEAELTWLEGAAHPVMIEAIATSESAGPKRLCRDMLLPLCFGLSGQRIEVRHRIQKPIERVGDDLLGRPAVDGACESQLEVALRIEPKRESRLPLATWGSTRARRTLGSRRSSASSDRNDDRSRFRLSFWIIGLGSLVQFFVAVINVQAVDNLRLLRVYW